MKNLIYSILTLLILSSCASITKTELATNVLIIADWNQTLQIKDDPNLYETNIFLGKYPSDEKINNYFASRLILNTILHRTLPKKLLTHYQIFVVIDQSQAIVNNYSLGLKVRF